MQKKIKDRMMVLILGIIVIVILFFVIKRSNAPEKSVRLLHYGDCVAVPDDFYGLSFGTVYKKVGNVYTIRFDMQPKPDIVTNDLDNLITVDHKYCEDPRKYEWRNVP